VNTLLESDLSIHSASLHGVAGVLPRRLQAFGTRALHAPEISFFIST
jgi:hypothetical protein